MHSQRLNNSGILAGLGLLMIILVSSGTARAQSPASSLSNQYCPVTTNELADENIFIDYQGRRVYFCCSKCRKDFLKNPEAYLANLPEKSEGAHSQSVAEHQTGGTESDRNHEHSPGTEHEQPDAAATQQPDHHADDSGESGTHGLAEQEGHDHATDHAEPSSVIGFLGKFHPVVVHFPIALVIIAATFLGLGIVEKFQQFNLLSVYLVYFAALSALAAATLGLIAGSGASYPSLLENYFWWHRSLGIASGILTQVSAFLAYRFQKDNSSGRLWSFRIVLALNAVLVGITGHLGAMLVYGPDYFTL